MSTNLLNNKDVWDDTELIRMYNESTKRITKAIIEKANIQIPPDDKNGNFLENESYNDASPTNDDEEEGVIYDDEDEEEGEIREKNIFIKDNSSRKRPIDLFEEIMNDNENENNQNSNNEIGTKSKNFKSSLESMLNQSPEEGKHDEEHEEGEQDHSQNLAKFSDTKLTEIQLQSSASSNPVTNSIDTRLKCSLQETLNATLGSFWQAGFHVRTLERSLNLKEGSLKIPIPKVFQNSIELSENLNASLISYWQMGYYYASCEQRLPDNLDT